MKHTDIEKLEAGPETDALILREVFGLEPQGGEEVLNYSENDCEALDVASFLSSDEEMNARPFQLTMAVARPRIWIASFQNEEFICAAPTIALAICRAALMYVTAQEE